MNKTPNRALATKFVVFNALLAALTTALTVAVRIPTPATGGYVHVGDAVLLFAGIVFGPVSGLIVGGLGSCLADLAGGYTVFILPTFIIKGAEGAVAGFLFSLLKKIRLHRYVAVLISTLFSGAIMVAGYFVADAVIKGSFAVSFVSVPANCVQAAVGIVFNFVLLVCSERFRGFGNLIGKNNYFEEDAVPKSLFGGKDKDAKNPGAPGGKGGNGVGED